MAHPSLESPVVPQEEVLASDAEEEAEASQRAEDSGHVTTDSSDSDSSGLDVPQVRRLTVPAAPRGFRFLQRKKTRMLHLIKDGNERVLDRPHACKPSECALRFLCVFAVPQSNW